MPTDLQFEANLKALHAAVTTRAKAKDLWAMPLVKTIEGAMKTFGAAGAKARAAESAWKKKIGAKSKIIDSAAAAWHAYANHLRADLTTDDLTQAVVPFESAGGLESSIDRLIEAFSKGGVAADVPYAKHALAELIPARHTLDALILETTKEYTAWRDAAGKKNAMRATAWELFKRGRRHLRAGTGKNNPTYQKIKTKAKKKKASQKTSPQPNA
jgi:hypothetical protein